MEYPKAEEEIERIIEESESSQVVQNVVDFLYEAFEAYGWVGVYIVQGDVLVLGPWRGKQATEHTKLPIGKGICGSAAASGQTEVIADVSQDERYLACFTSTCSEIVVPIWKKRRIVGEIDIDSEFLDAFGHQDTMFLENVAALIAKYIF